MATFSPSRDVQNKSFDSFPLEGYKASESTKGNLWQSANSSFYVWKLEDAYFSQKHFVMLAKLSTAGRM